MTRKHFEAIAKAIAYQRATEDNDTERMAIDRVAMLLSAVFEGFNDDFDSDRFLEACRQPL